MIISKYSVLKVLSNDRPNDPLDLHEDVYEVEEQIGNLGAHSKKSHEVSRIDCLMQCAVDVLFHLVLHVVLKHNHQNLFGC